MAGTSLVLTIREAASELRMCERWVAEEIKAGRLRSVKYGRSRRIRRSDLVRFVESRDDAREAPQVRRRRRPAAPIGEPVPFPEYAREARA